MDVLSIHEDAIIDLSRVQRECWTKLYGEPEMSSDPIKTFYLKGWEDAKAGKRASGAVPHNFKLAYRSGRYDFHAGKPNRYEGK